MNPSLPARIYRTIQWLLMVAVILTLALLMGGLAWQWAKAAVARDAYRVRLADLESHHNALVHDYNQAIARTAVCEVRNINERLSVSVRTADGRVEDFPLPFDPKGEIHFDFVCQDGRLMMRRVYDSQTAPQNGILIQSALMGVDWSKNLNDRGLELYRPVPQGRYQLKASGNGALTLEPMTQAEIAQLEHAPRLRAYEPVEPVREASEPPSLWEIWRGLIQK